MVNSQIVPEARRSYGWDLGGGGEDESTEVDHLGARTEGSPRANVVESTRDRCPKIGPTMGDGLGEEEREEG